MQSTNDRLASLLRQAATEAENGNYIYGEFSLESYPEEPTYLNLEVAVPFDNIGDLKNANND